ncbi:MAG: hypothetical protein WDM86_09655 [Rhizomicrobium sp.]
MQNGTLFTDDFLREGILQTPDWQQFSKSEFDTIKAELKKIVLPFHSGATHNEADTEERIIYPVLSALGWQGLILRKNTMAKKGHDDIPDALLLPNGDALTLADKAKQAAEKFRHGVVVCEAKKWEMPLDQGKGDIVPSTQMLRYLTRADVMSEGRILWGVLTNGRVWRLYWQRAKSRSEQFVEFDLGMLLGIVGHDPDLFAPSATEADHLLSAFIVMFRRDAFLPTRDKGRTFHDVALEEGRLWEARVAKSLSDLVFQDVYPGFIKAIAAASPTSALTDVRQAALTLLYRLLFILYAEDRDLLPKRDKRYAEYGLFKRVRLEVAQRIDDSDTFSTKAAHYWSHARTLFHIIDEGDAAIGLPPYNGGLFDRTDHVLLDSIEIPDAIFAPLADMLSRTHEAEKKLINYRDLSVQQLGSIYERLLEYEPVHAEGGGIEVRLNPFARKGSGSYYTPDELVALIIDQTVGPLVSEHRNAFRAKADALKAGKRPVAERLAELQKADIATTLLELKVCDPAMGSGHFLVHLVDYLADKAIEALADAPKFVSWGEYASSVADRIDVIRTRILKEAEANNWNVRADQLEDRMIVRRMVLKRAVYGVDKNPMAVELAKVSLWLHTFTVGAPLSFLDHHLRCGDSLFGEWVGKTERELSESAGLFINNSVVHARQASKLMLDIESAADADLAEARHSAEAFGGVREATDPLSLFLSFWHALKWVGDRTAEQRIALDGLLRGTYGDPVSVVSGSVPLNIKAVSNADIEESKLSKREKAERKAKQAAAKQLPALFDAARKISNQERFLHWEVAFPGVWADWESAEPKGGFDAVIGNPPWDRMKMQEVEWFAARRPQIALAQRAADRKQMIEDLKKKHDPLYADYQVATARADAALELARNGGEYPLLGGGDLNIYSLFVERAQRLLKSDGIAGLLVPSGIASDKGASEFFRSIATSGRLVALLDFENRGIFFPDVHNSFKFCAFIATGPKRAASAAQCGFFLTGEEELTDPERCFPLTPADFALVNPNTGTAPIFRTRRDAETTTDIYKRVPILVRRDADGDVVTSDWPVRYSTMLHMTNDSALFWSRERLLAHGAYPVSGGLWRKGKQEFVPLYEGKMVQAFDHRAASIVINPANIHRPAQPLPATLAEHMKPEWTPTPQFWVDRKSDSIPSGIGGVLGFKDVTAPTNERTMIAAIIPATALGNTLPVLLPASDGDQGSYASKIALLAANFNSFVFDFIARQKVQGQHLNWYIVEQLPTLPEAAYARKLGKRKAADVVRSHVLRLSYTAHDLAPFARDMGHIDPKTGEVRAPFSWDEEERAHLRARLDALFFLLYGVVDRDDVSYILSTFHGVQEDDVKKFARYRTRDLILAYMNALEAGDAESTVSI